MYVCICAAVTDRQFRAAAAAGAATLDDLAVTLGVGTGCGCCREHAQQLLEEHCGGNCNGCPNRSAHAVAA
jgi:bacterioferritin-associated ferredoxin